MNVWLVLSALCLTDVNVCEPELVLQATYFTKPVLVNHDSNAFSMPPLLTCNLVLALSNAFVNQVQKIIFIPTFVLLIVSVAFKFFSNSDGMELITWSYDALWVEFSPH